MHFVASEKENLRASIIKKTKQIQFLELIFRAIRTLQERKSSDDEMGRLGDLENNLSKLS